MLAEGQGALRVAVAAGGIESAIEITYAQPEITSMRCDIGCWEGSRLTIRVSAARRHIYGFGDCQWCFVIDVWMHPSSCAFLSHDFLLWLERE